MTDSPKLWHWPVLGLVLQSLLIAPVFAQPATDSPPAPPAAAPDTADELDSQFIDEQIASLSHASYRARQLARWRLEQAPLQAIAAIRGGLPSVDYHTGAQLVDILSGFATHADVAVSAAAREALQRHANRVSAVGRLADNALHAIADLQEGQALEMLRFHGARFGSSNFLGLVFNGKPHQEMEDFAMVLDGSFTGGEEVVAWIQFLKTVDTVYIEGTSISPAHFRAVAQLPNIKKLKCKHVSISRDDLGLLKNCAWLELLELAYVDIDDSYLGLLEQLPISETLRLFGTQISIAGAERLARQLDGIEIYCARGGHLGIATHPSNTLVTAVNNNTGAQRAGIRESDELTHVNGVEIANMTELRAQLATHAAGDTIQISLTRQIYPNAMQELTLDVTLTEDPN